MAVVPIVSHYTAAPARAEERRVERLAPELVREQRRLAIARELVPHAPLRLGDGPSLHLDDLGEIPFVDRFYDPSYLEDRARFRASTGDFVASCAEPADGWEQYCRDRLGLGDVTYLRPRKGRSALGVATACWCDRAVRHELVSALRRGCLRYIHPHMGSFPVWALARLLHARSRKPIEVIAPPPGLTAAVNDKGWFADVVRRLFGAALVPPMAEAWNLATLARLTRQYAEDWPWIVVKVPDSAGGAGNVILDGTRLRFLSVGALRELLRARLGDLLRDPTARWLIGRWETHVLQSPSLQLWVPPELDGPPVVEGIYEQQLSGDEGTYVGNRPADLPDDVTQELVDRSWLLARLFQRLGYVGRCSFDLLLVGESLDRCRPEFIECNGRWGGTSIPMTLMNRLVGDFFARAYETRECRAPGLERMQFADLVEQLDAELYDVRTGRGRAVLFNPGAMHTIGAIDVLLFGDTVSAVDRQLDDFERRLRAIAQPMI